MKYILTKGDKQIIFESKNLKISCDEELPISKDDIRSAISRSWVQGRQEVWVGYYLIMAI